ncbi:MAG: glycoside hydrolase family 57 protein [Prolixibacteraceae bacterium]|nr:glycoside hydrolase family 57 protein [Prolixibacteraceae bacterium]
MKSICFLFQVHQPFRFRKYRFFDIGNDHYYYDDYANDTILQRIAANCYLPANKILLELCEKYNGDFKVAFSISGTALEQFELYAPEVIQSFQALAKTGCVEFLSGTFSHSLASLSDKKIFEEQAFLHSKKIIGLFGQKPTVFANTEMIYSDEIGEQVAAMGFKGMITEGAKHILGWKSPNYVYVNAINPKLKILMRNFKLSDDLTFRFSNKAWSEFPLTADKFVDWIEQIDEKNEVINLFLNYETFGEIQKKETGIFDFLRYFPQKVLESEKLKFSKPEEVIKEFQPISAVHVPLPVSWADEERDLSAWLGNYLQKEAFEKLTEMNRYMESCEDEEIRKDWNYLQAGDHFYYMSTKYFNDGQVHRFFNPYSSPYEAFINYMNVLSDFKLRLNLIFEDDNISREIESYKEAILRKDKELKKLKAELSRLKKTNSKQVKK